MHYNQATIIKLCINVCLNETDVIKIGNVNIQFALFIGIMALSYFLKRIKIIKEQDGDGISRVIFNITLPALIINTFNSMKIDKSLLIISVISLVYGLFMSLFGIFIFRKEPRKSRGALSMLVPAFNVGLFAYPLFQAIWGEKSLKYIGMFDMGNTIPTFVFCYIIACYFSSGDAKISYKDIFKKLISSIPLMSYVITLIINLAGLHYPEPVVAVCKLLQKANMPLSLILLGICLNFSIDKKFFKSMMKILLSRYGIGLFVGIILFKILPFEPIFRYTILIGLILPIAMAVVPFSVQLGYDKKFTGTMCSITIILSFALTWIIISV